jgi:hypothetical protein
MARIVSCVAVVCFLAGAALGQESQATAPASAGQSEPQVPQIDAPQKPAPGTEMGMMSGSKPFTLVTEPGGEMNYNFNADNEVESLVARRGVVFTNEDMTLKCDQLDYKATTGELVANGKKVIVRLGEVIASCKLFKYFPNDQRSELTGRPMLYNSTSDGKVTTTEGEKIIIAMVDGKPQIKVVAGRKGTTLSSGGGTAPSAPNTARISSTTAPDSGAKPEARPDMAGESSSISGNTTAPESAGQTPAAKSSNKIDVNNPADLKSYSQKKQ